MTDREWWELLLAKLHHYHALARQGKKTDVTILFGRLDTQSQQTRIEIREHGL